MRINPGNVNFGEHVTGEHVTIDGIKYVVMRSSTASMYRDESKPNLARELERYGQRRHLYLMRPKGSVIYFAVQYDSGRYSTVVSLGRARNPLGNPTYTEVEVRKWYPYTERKQWYLERLNPGEHVTIDDVDYVVMTSTTPDGYRNIGKPNLARVLERYNQRRHLYLRRPNESAMYFAVQYNSGRYGKVIVVSLGRARNPLGTISTALITGLGFGAGIAAADKLIKRGK